MKLPSQVHVSHDQPTAETLRPVVDREAFWKPWGGLWTSTWENNASQWTDWLIGEGYTDWSDPRWGGKLWLLEPKDAAVYAINGPDELLELRDRYPSPHAERNPEITMFRTLVDWPSMAKDYDAAWVPNPWPWRFGYDDLGVSMFFYVMDAESTCWFRWCFEDEVTEIDLSTLKSYRWNDDDEV